MEFTEEQKRIVELVKQGKTNLCIAKDIGYSQRSVERRLQVLYNEFGATNKASFIIGIMSAEYKGFI